MSIDYLISSTLTIQFSLVDEDTTCILDSFVPPEQELCISSTNINGYKGMSGLLGLFAKKKTPEQVVAQLRKDLLDLAALPTAGLTPEDKVSELSDTTCNRSAS